MAEFIDLRSDTVTKPTPAMRRAMAEAEAEVGDDVFGEDPDPPGDSPGYFSNNCLDKWDHLT